MLKINYEQLAQYQTRDINRVLWRSVSNRQNKGNREDNRLTHVAIVTLAWLMKDSQGQTPDTLDLSPFTADQQLIQLLNNVAKKHWNNVGKLCMNYDKEELLAYILFDNHDDRMPTAEPLKRLASRLINVGGGDRILDFDCDTGAFLLETHVSHPNSHLIGVAFDEESYQIAQLKNQLLNRVATFHLADSTTPLIIADKIISIASQRDSQRSQTTFEWDIEQVMASLSDSPDSQAAIICHDFTPRFCKETLQKMLEHQQLKAVISLPELQRLRNQNLLLILSRHNSHVRMVDASRCYTAQRRAAPLSDSDIDSILSLYQSDNECARNVPVAEVVWNDYELEPARYLAPPINLSNTVNLGELCTINRGSMLSARKLDELISEAPTDYQYISLKHLGEMGLDSDLPYLQQIDDRQKKYCVQNNQVIISKMSPFRVCLAIVPMGRKVLASGNLYFLDIDRDKITPIYLKMFLESELGMMQLDRLSKGGAMRTISITDLKQVQIPLLPLAEQEQLAADYQAIEKEIRDIQEQMNKAIQAKKQIMLNKINCLTQNGEKK